MSLLHAVASNVLSVLTLVDNGMLLWLISWVHLRSISKIEMPSSNYFYISTKCMCLCSIGNLSELF